MRDVRKKPPPVRQMRAWAAGYAVTKKRDGYHVCRRSDGRSDYLNFIEGFRYRLGLGLPHRVLEWPPAERAVVERG